MKIWNKKLQASVFSGALVGIATYGIQQFGSWGIVGVSIGVGVATTGLAYWGMLKK